tara:strand:- start:1166 stop:1822 length:657 start_codon:yes stop_codon:yes gene_type:complete
MTTPTSNAKMASEFIGTFFLTMTIFIAAVLGLGGDIAPFGIAATLMVMIYALGHISGAHFNPAVSIGLFLRGACSKDDLPFYLMAQLAAGVVAGLIGVNLFAGDVAISAFEFAEVTNSVLAAEFLFTFALMFVILHVATEQDGNPFYGAAIAFTVLAGAITVGGISGGSFNPAVTSMLMVTGKLAVADCWMHLMPQLAGAVVAVYAYRFTMTSENDNE